MKYFINGFIGAFTIFFNIWFLFTKRLDKNLAGPPKIVPGPPGAMGPQGLPGKSADDKFSDLLTTWLKETQGISFKHFINWFQIQPSIKTVEKLDQYSNDKAADTTTVRPIETQFEKNKNGIINLGYVGPTEMNHFTSGGTLSEYLTFLESFPSSTPKDFNKWFSDFITLAFKPYSKYADVKEHYKVLHPLGDRKHYFQWKREFKKRIALSKQKQTEINV